MQITLKVENLCVKLTEPPRQVLNSICAHVKPGQILGKCAALTQNGRLLRHAAPGGSAISARRQASRPQRNKAFTRRARTRFENQVTRRSAMWVESVLISTLKSVG